MDTLEEQLNFFGYTDTDSQNPYSFFKYGESAKDIHKNAFDGYK